MADTEAVSIEASFVRAICDLMEQQNCRPDQPTRCAAMIGALSMCAGGLIGAMDAYGSKLGGTDAAMQDVRTMLVKLATARMSSAGNFTSELMDKVWGK